MPTTNDDDEARRHREDKSGWIVFGIITVIVILLATVGHWALNNDANTNSNGAQYYCDEYGC